MDNIEIKLPEGKAAEIRERAHAITQEAAEGGVHIVAAEKHGVLVGTITGKITGSFTLTDMTLRVTITDKPLFATIWMIESKIRGYFRI